MRRRPLLTFLALAPAFALLAGCGFTPLYANGGTATALSSIEVSAPDGRLAYLLRERLDDALAKDRSRPPLYRLSFTLDEQRDPRGLGPENAASRYELSLYVDYVLTEIAGGREVRTGRQQVLISYEAVDPPFAGVVAQQDSQERAAAEAARRIRADLAQYFIKTVG